MMCDIANKKEFEKYGNRRKWPKSAQKIMLKHHKPNVKIRD